MLSIGKLSYLAEMQATHIPNDSELDGIPPLWFAVLSHEPSCDQHSTVVLTSLVFKKESWKNYVPIHLPLVHVKLLKPKSMLSCIQKEQTLLEKMHLPPSAL